MNIKPIRDRSDLATAKAQLAKLLAQPAQQDRNDKIEVLTTLIEQFEQKNARVDLPDPISALKYRMEEGGLTARQLEPYIGSRARVSEILSGKRSLSIDMIRSLHEGLGLPYESLMGRGTQQPDFKEIPNNAITQLNKLGFSLDRSEIPSFISSSVANNSPLALHRKTRTHRAASKTDPNTLLLWQAAVIQKSENLNLKNRFRKDQFDKAALRKLAVLSSKPLGARRVVEALCNLGIATVFIPSLPGTFLDGAAMVRSDGVPVIGLTLRFDRVDNFWFTLQHEMAHLSLHYDVLVESHIAFIDDMEIQSEDKREQEADALARDSLIPATILEQVVWNHTSSYDDIVTVATRARVPISVVAGRWQRDHLNYKKFSKLIDRTSVRALLAVD